MPEYKVFTCWVMEAEAQMNRMAAEGWRVVAVTPNHAVGHGVIITYEREKA